VNVTKDFKKALCDRFESWELAEFLQIPIEEFVEMFEEEIEINYEDLAEYVGLKTGGDYEYDQVDQFELYGIGSDS